MEGDRIVKAAQELAVRENGLLRSVLRRADLIFDPVLPVGKGLLDGDGEGKRLPGEGTEPAIQQGQGAVQVDVPVQHHQSVGRVVVFGVLGNELLIGQRGNMDRVAPGGMMIAGIREQIGHHGVLQDIGHIGVSALHLVVHHPLEHGGAVLGKFQPPALLPEDPGVGGGPGVEHRVHVDVHQVAEVLPVPAGHGVDRFVRVGHGVEEGLQGAFQQLHKRLLHRIFLTAVQHRMLQNVENAGGIGGDGAEAHGEGHVFLLPLEPHQLGPAFFVLHFPEGALHFFDLPGTAQGEMVLFKDSFCHGGGLLIKGFSALK